MAAEQGLLRGENPNANFFNYLRHAEGYRSEEHKDAGKNAKQTNFGFGTMATEVNKEYRQSLLDNLPFDKEKKAWKRETDSIILKMEMIRHKDRAREKFDKFEKNAKDKPFDSQPFKVQQLLTELEFNGGLLKTETNPGWPKLMRHAKKGNYQGVEEEMYLDEKLQGAKVRNEKRREYFSGELDSGLPFMNVRGPSVGSNPATTIPAGFPQQQPPLKLGEPTGEYTPEGRPLFWNNRGTKSSEYSTGVKDERINNKALTHIPSIYDGRILNDKDAAQRVVDANGYDPLTGRFIEPGGDPNARSGSLQSIPHHIGGATTDTSRYRQQRLPSLEEAAATAQTQPVLTAFLTPEQKQAEYKNRSFLQNLKHQLFPNR